MMPAYFSYLAVILLGLRLMTPRGRLRRFLDAS
jgi:hypothetical protein